LHDLVEVKITNWSERNGTRGEKSLDSNFY